MLNLQLYYTSVIADTFNILNYLKFPWCTKLREIVCHHISLFLNNDSPGKVSHEIAINPAYVG